MKSTLRIPAHTARAFILAALVPSTALAAGGTDDDFRVAPSAHDGMGALQLAHPSTGGQGAGYVGGAFTTGEDFAAPLGYRRMASVHLSGGFAVANWLRVEADMPFVSSIARGDQSVDGAGDLQLSGTLPFIVPGTRNFGIGVVPFAEVPTAATTSADTLEWGGLLTLGAGDGTLGWRVNAGLRSDTATTREVVMGAGGNARLGELFAAGLEVVSTRPAGPTDPGTPEQANPLETTAYGMFGQDRRAAVQLGVTAGLIPDAGSPTYRFLALPRH